LFSGDLFDDKLLNEALEDIAFYGSDFYAFWKIKNWWEFFHKIIEFLVSKNPPKSS
jgi:hypothetical protein